MQWNITISNAFMVLQCGVRKETELFPQRETEDFHGMEAKRLCQAVDRARQWTQQLQERLLCLWTVLCCQWFTGPWKCNRVYLIKKIPLARFMYLGTVSGPKAPSLWHKNTPGGRKSPPVYETCPSVLCGNCLLDQLTCILIRQCPAPVQCKPCATVPATHQ